MLLGGLLEPRLWIQKLEALFAKDWRVRDDEGWLDASSSTTYILNSRIRMAGALTTKGVVVVWPIFRRYRFVVVFKPTAAPKFSRLLPSMDVTLSLVFLP